MALIFGPPKFMIAFPDDWKDETVYSFKGPEDSGIQHGLLVIVDEESEPKNLPKYVQGRIAALESTLTGVEFLKEGERKLPTGHPAFEVVYKWVPSEGKILFQKQVWIQVESVVFNLVASFSKKTIKTIGREVDAIIDTFQPPSAQAVKGAPAKDGAAGMKIPLAVRKPEAAAKKPVMKLKAKAKNVPPPAAKKPRAIRKPVAKKPIAARKQAVMKKPAGAKKEPWGIKIKKITRK